MAESEAVCRFRELHAQETYGFGERHAKEMDRVWFMEMTHTEQLVELKRDPTITRKLISWAGILRRG